MPYVNPTRKVDPARYWDSWKCDICGKVCMNEYNYLTHRGAGHKEEPKQVPVDAPETLGSNETNKEVKVE